MNRILQLSLIIALTTGSGRAAGPEALTYQGNLRDVVGQPVPDGLYPMRFEFHDDRFIGSMIHTETVADVVVTDGFFSAVLAGFGNLFQDSDNLWLEIAVDVDGDGVEANEIYAPRQRVTTAPYTTAATQADNADALGGAARSQFIEIDEDEIHVLGENGFRNASLTSVGGQPNQGALIARDVDGSERGTLLVLSDGSGTLALRGPNDNVGVGIFSTDDVGAIEIANAAGALRTTVEVFTDDVGGMLTFGPNGSLNASISNTAQFPSRGAVAVRDELGAVRAGMIVDNVDDGLVFADVMTAEDFILVKDHPKQSGAKIVQRGLAGSEAGIYRRGVAKLIDGRGTIELPDHFAVLADPDSITIHLTPASFESKGVAVGSIEGRSIEIGELMGGAGTYEVHYIIHAAEIGRTKHDPVLSGEEFQKRFGARPALKRNRVKRVVPKAKP